MSTTEMAGYLAAFSRFLTFYMKTMIPLRLVGICSNLIFITYAYLGSLHPVLVLHLILLPLNGLRLREMLRLTREVRGATQGDLKMDWLKPFTSVRRSPKRGDILFRKGDAADAMGLVVCGHFRLVELGKDISAGQIFGELGLLAPRSVVPRTLECIEEGEVLRVTSEQVKQLCYQNPQFPSIFCSSPPNDYSRIFHHSNGIWPHARLQALGPGR